MFAPELFREQRLLVIIAALLVVAGLSLSIVHVAAQFEATPCGGDMAAFHGYGMHSSSSGLFAGRCPARDGSWHRESS